MATLPTAKAMRPPTPDDRRGNPHRRRLPASTPRGGGAYSGWRPSVTPSVRPATAELYLELGNALRQRIEATHACEKRTPSPRHPISKRHLLLDLPVVVLVHRIFFFGLGDDLHLRLPSFFNLFLELLLQLASFEII